MILIIILALMVYGVLMILRQINIANGTYHYSDHDVNKINKTFGMKWETTDFNRSSTESSKIKPNVPQMSDAEVEAKLHYNWNIFIDKLKTLPYTKVMYYKGHVTIDGKGDYNNKEFYLYADLGYGDFNKYVPSVNTLYLLEVNYTKFVYAILVNDENLKYYTLSSDKTMTIINTSQGKLKQEIYLDSSAYDVMLKNYPMKDLEYINEHKIV